MTVDAGGRRGPRRTGSQQDDAEYGNARPSAPATLFDFVTSKMSLSSSLGILCDLVHRGRVQQLTGRIGRTGPLGRPMLDRSAVGQLPSLSSRTKQQRLPAGDALRTVSPAGSRMEVVQQLTCLT